MRDEAAAIWTAGMRAVQPERLMATMLSVVGHGRQLVCDGQPLDRPIMLDDVARIVVVGGGKAAAGLAAGLEGLLGPTALESHRVTGLVSVPQGCGMRLARIEVRETRPAGANLPTPAVVQATREMLAMLESLGPRDLAIALVTGGASALVAAPRAGITLDEKIALTRDLSQAGADIATLNAARRRLSLVKGGGLARACRAERLLVLVISDVVGDDLDVIASGPCMPAAPQPHHGSWTTPAGCHTSHLLLGTNATAVDAAAAAAAQRGYAVTIRHATPGVATAAADLVGTRLAGEAAAILSAARSAGPQAVIEGGEATVTVPADHGLGGRNQQTALAALEAMRASTGTWPTRLLLASVGTDGEDGPTDAAGGLIDAAVAEAVTRGGYDVAAALARRDAYPLLAATGGLVRTGPTGTNVADLRIILARP